MRYARRPEVPAALLGAAVILGLYVAALVHADPMSLDVDAVKKFSGHPAGFKLVDPGTGQPETVVIEATVKLGEDEFTEITRVALDMSQEAGDEGYIDSTVELLLPVAPDYASIESFDLTVQLPLGQLFVDVALVNVVPDAFGFGYGYQGGQGGGSIDFAIRYTPSAIAGGYQAVLRVLFEDTVRALSSTQFIILKPFSSDQVQALATIYPRSDTEALSRDLVVLRARISDEVAEHLVSVTVDPGLLGPTTRSMDRTSQFHPAMLAKWGIAIEDPGEANFLLPMKIIPQADPLTGTFSTSVKATDISGQEVELTDSSAPTVVVSDRRERFNVYLMPGLNIISTPLECSTGPVDCTEDFGFEIEELLKQPVTNADPGFSTIGDVIEIIWYYCPVGTDSTCPGGGDTPKFVSFAVGRVFNLLTVLRAGIPRWGTWLAMWTWKRSGCGNSYSPS